MKAEQHANPSADQIGFDDTAICEICGRFGAFHIGQRVLCRDCYEGAGSCCPEFGKDDLWIFDDEKKKSL